MDGAQDGSGIFIGWDVGGWNCDYNPKSRDALILLDGNLCMLGKAWRGNLRAAINAAESAEAFIAHLFRLCAAGSPPAQVEVTLAIDTPLGFSREFVDLITWAGAVGTVGSSESNPYLFRQTERHLFALGLTPLSAVKDMIGSQATKALHLLARVAALRPRCGVWTDGARLTVIEAYPSACRPSACMADLRRQVKHAPFQHPDEEDALTCALTAYLFARRPELLMPPGGDVPLSEGWIWAPKDIDCRGIT